MITKPTRYSEEPITQHLPNATKTFDTFPLAAKLSEAVDAVRRTEVTTRPELTRTRWRWLKNFSNLSVKQKAELHQLMRPSAKLVVRRRDLRQSLWPMDLSVRAIDQFGQIIDVLASEKRDLAATRRFFTRALEHGPRPTEVSTDRAPAYPRALDELVPAAGHVVEQYANNPIEADHGRLKSRL